MKKDKQQKNKQNNQNQNQQFNVESAQEQNFDQLKKAQKKNDKNCN